ncbi:MAG: ABC transporter ATP-binding protein [Phycisphaerae bacterium]
MTTDHGAILQLTDVRFGYAAPSPFLGPIDFELCPGQCWAVVGPNGAGKTTLLRLLAGLAKATSGSVHLRGRPIESLSHRDRARVIAYLPQHTPADLDLAVRDVVLMGRFPHRSMGLFESAEDHRIAERAMECTAVTALADRPLATLSGGEAQRVQLAAALAQAPAVLLLDEPTASLDLQHQLEIFGILRDRAAGGGLAVVVVTHDVNLAGQFCSNVMLLDKGRCVLAGPPDEVLTPATLESVYGVRLATLTLSDLPGRQWVVPLEPAGGSDA